MPCIVISDCGMEVLLVKAGSYDKSVMWLLFVGESILLVEYA